MNIVRIEFMDDFFFCANNNYEMYKWRKCVNDYKTNKVQLKFTNLWIKIFAKLIHYQYYNNNNIK